MKFLTEAYWQGFFSALAGWAASFIVPAGPFIILVTFLVLADLYTGIRAAVNRGEKIRSKGLRRTVEKLILYFIAILLAEGMKHVFAEDVPVTYITGFAICLTEFKSVIENIESVTGVKIWTSLKGAFSKINFFNSKAKKHGTSK